MAKSFNKQTFKNSQKKILLACLCMMLIGIFSIICAFAVGEGLGLGSFFDRFGYRDPDAKVEIKSSDNFGKDPKDYYGVYYYEADYVIYKIEITENGATLLTESLSESETGEYSLQYADKKYADKKFKMDSPVLIVYDKDGNISNYSAVWSLKKDDSGAYYLEMGRDLGVSTYTKNPITMDGLWRIRRTITETTTEPVILAWRALRSIRIRWRYGLREPDRLPMRKFSRIATYPQVLQRNIWSAKMLLFFFTPKI